MNCIKNPIVKKVLAGSNTCGGRAAYDRAVNTSFILLFAYHSRPEAVMIGGVHIA
jgi:hypothetical protein